MFTKGPSYWNSFFQYHKKKHLSYPILPGGQKYLLIANPAMKLHNWIDWISEAHIVLSPNKKISVFRVTGLKILGRVGTYSFSNFFFLEKI